MSAAAGAPAFATSATFLLSAGSDPERENGDEKLTNER
jgi:hypothetical protein